jgi:hypothetical protein
VSEFEAPYFYVVVEETVCFNNSFEFLVRGKVLIDDKQLVEGMYRFSPMNEKLSKRNLIAANALVTLNSSKMIPVQILRDSTNEVVINKGFILGTVTMYNKKRNYVRYFNDSKETENDFNKMKKTHLEDNSISCENQQ